MNIRSWSTSVWNAVVCAVTFAVTVLALTAYVFAEEQKYYEPTDTTSTVYEGLVDWDLLLDDSAFVLNGEFKTHSSWRSGTYYVRFIIDRLCVPMEKVFDVRYLKDEQYLKPIGEAVAEVVGYKWVNTLTPTNLLQFGNKVGLPMEFQITPNMNAVLVITQLEGEDGWSLCNNSFIYDKTTVIPDTY